VWRKTFDKQFPQAYPLFGVATSPLVFDGKLRVLKAKADKWEPVREYTVCDAAVWAHPAVGGGTVVVKDKAHLYCWQVK
jgi:hypothetical protein